MKTVGKRGVDSFWNGRALLFQFYVDLPESTRGGLGTSELEV